MTSRDQNEGAYRSGVAARLAGVPVDTLRIWERRYSVVGPRTSEGGQRLYSHADIRRLTMIKQFVDMGHAIGTVAVLDTKVLSGMRATTRSLRETHPRQPQSASVPKTGVALVGAMLAADQFAKALAGSALDVVGRCADPDKAVFAFEDVHADIAIIELPTMRDADLERVAAIKAACGAANAIVLYRFASGVLVRRMRMAGYAVARATSDPAELEAICLGLLPHTGTDASDTLQWLAATQPRPPRFDAQSLAELAGVSQAIECECPKHLVDLVLNLGAFERYSAECANRGPADALLHLDLQRAAGLARSIIEQALERVVIAEGIALTAPAVSP